MAQETGFVNKNSEAVVSIALSNGEKIACVIDTGFNGSLLLPRKFTTANPLKFVGREEVELVDEISLEIDTVLGEFVWFGEKIKVRLFISETGESLIGTEMLAAAVLEIDYKNKTVKITKI